MLPLRAFRVRFGAQVGQLPAQLVEAGDAGGVGLLGQCRLLDLQPHDPAGQLVQLGRHRVDLGTQPRAGLVNQVDRLVGQEPVGDVAMAQGRRGHKGRVLDLDTVEDLQPLAQAAQDRDRILHGGLVDHYRLESPGQRGVLLHALAVLVERGGSDHVQLAAGQHWLEHVAGVHRALGGPGAHDGVQLVDEEQDPSLGGLHLGQHGLEPFLELAAVLGSGDERAYVEREDGLVLQSFGDVTLDDPLGQAFRDGGLAHSGVADEDRVVLGLAGQDLDDPPDLGVAADDRVELAAAGLVDEVSAIFLERLVGHLGHRRCDPLVASHPGQGRQERVTGDAVILEQTPGRGPRALIGQGEEEVLDRHVLVLESAGLALRGVQQPGQALGDEHLTRRGAGARDLGSAGQFGLDVAPHRVRIRPDGGDQTGYEALGLVEQGEQQVFPVDLGVPQTQRLGLGVVECFLRLLGQPVHVHGVLLERRNSVSSSSMRSSRSSTRPIAA